jgi:hypothetical protein
MNNVILLQNILRERVWVPNMSTPLQRILTAEKQLPESEF